jgi:hypothetical protein
MNDQSVSVDGREISCHPKSGRNTDTVVLIIWIMGTEVELRNLSFWKA